MPHHFTVRYSTVLQAPRILKCQSYNRTTMFVVCLVHRDTSVSIICVWYILLSLTLLGYTPCDVTGILYWHTGKGPRLATWRAHSVQAELSLCDQGVGSRLRWMEPQTHTKLQTTAHRIMDHYMYTACGHAHATPHDTVLQPTDVRY